MYFLKEATSFFGMNGLERLASNSCKVLASDAGSLIPSTDEGISTSPMFGYCEN